MDFIQNVLNGMANRRPRLDACVILQYDHGRALRRVRRALLAFLSAYDGTGRPQKRCDGLITGNVRQIRRWQKDRSLS